MKKVSKLTMTCGACPSQWEGKLETGEYIYIRFRWGMLQVGIGETIDDAIRDTESVYFDINPYAGTMDTGEMMQHAGLEWA